MKYTMYLSITDCWHEVIADALHLIVGDIGFVEVFRFCYDGAQGVHTHHLVHMEVNAGDP